MCKLGEYDVNQYASQFIFAKLYSNILMKDIQKNNAYHKCHRHR